MERIHTPYWGSGNNLTVSLITRHTQKHHAARSAQETEGCILKQEDNHVTSKDKQGAVLTGSSEDILFLFYRQLIAKSTPLKTI